MATDIEESDTDDHERPAPPKRQCTRVLDVDERSKSLNKRPGEAEVCENEENADVERLNVWQECQVTKGFLDNAINCIVEDYIVNPPVAYSPADESSRCRLFRGNEMEDTAITMAIRNCGLVHSSARVDLAPDICWTNDEKFDLSCSMKRTNGPEALPSSSALFDPARSGDAVVNRDASSWNEDKMDENDREQDFLERAVAEAIKKKGLSALSVDYG